MATLGVTATDITAAVQGQNRQNPSGTSVNLRSPPVWSCNIR
jgi:multidrug efflux pump subunit AcrB